MDIHPNLENYELLYGALPDTQEELEARIMKDYNIDPEDAKHEELRLCGITWNLMDFTVFIVPAGTPRPRMDGTHFYVSGAKSLHRVFSKYFRDHGIICTRVEYDLECYLPTPTNRMTPMEIYMCERGLIKPIVTPDWDNLAKTYTDCLQSVLIINDNIITDGRVKKYYSIKPRIKILIRWQADFDCDYNRKKTLTSVTYRKLIGGNKSDDQRSYPADSSTGGET